MGVRSCVTTAWCALKRQAIRRTAPSKFLMVTMSPYSGSLSSRCLRNKRLICFVLFFFIRGRFGACENKVTLSSSHYMRSWSSHLILEFSSIYLILFRFLKISHYGAILAAKKKKKKKTQTFASRQLLCEEAGFNFTQ